MPVPSIMRVLTVAANDAGVTAMASSYDEARVAREEIGSSRRPTRARAAGHGLGQPA